MLNNIGENKMINKIFIFASSLLLFSTQGAFTSDLTKLHKLGGSRDLSTMGQLTGIKYCPTVLTTQKLTLLKNASTRVVKQGGITIGTVYNKITLHSGVNQLSANAKASPSDMRNIMQSSTGNQVIAVLKKDEEIRAQDTGLVKKGASLCYYSVYSVSIAEYQPILRGISEGLKHFSFDTLNQFVSRSTHGGKKSQTLIVAVSKTN